MAECSSSNVKWSCSVCTYLNYESSLKCTVCLTPREKCPIIEETASASINFNENNSQNLEERWSCPSCTYLNCLRTKKCIQCQTERPLRYGSNTSINQTSKTADLKQSSGTISKALNKWSCSSCTFFNWPNASRCTMCGTVKSIEIKENKVSPSPCSQTSQSGILQITKDLAATNLKKTEHYTSALDIYLRRFVGNDHIESLFFKAAIGIERRDIEMVNSVVNYLINEGNLQRSLNTFETRLLNSHSLQNTFETGDCLIDIAKKCDSMDLVKLLKRVTPTDDKLPCSLNCSSRTRIWAKIAQLFAIRNGNFCAQFIAHPYNFNILKCNFCLVF